MELDLKQSAYKKDTVSERSHKRNVNKTKAPLHLSLEQLIFQANFVLVGQIRFAV